MDCKEFLEQLDREKGKDYAEAVRVAALGRSIIGIVMALGIDEDQRELIIECLVGYCTATMTLVSTSLKQPPTEIIEHAERLINLAEAGHKTRASQGHH